jgi:hypothetical protein
VCERSALCLSKNYSRKVRDLAHIVPGSFVIASARPTGVWHTIADCPAPLAGAELYLSATNNEQHRNCLSSRSSLFRRNAAEEKKKLN